MTEPKQTGERLEKRRGEINQQLNKTNEDERIELGNDMKEQSIQVEQREVSVTM